MANKHSSLTALFTDIANAIREKTGGTATIIADDFPDVIRERLQVIPTIPYLTFSSPSSFTLRVNDATKHWDGTLEYSTDTSTWSTWDGTTTLSSAANGSDNVLYLRGTGNTVITGDNSNCKWVLAGSDVACIGNIENLLDYTTVKSWAHPTMANYCYGYMFSSCKALTQAPALPATTLANYCYMRMFQNCTGLAQAPALPATTLAPNCYYNMFYGCTGLTQAPELPATTLASFCYRYMFQNCANLTNAPALPATTLEAGCYNSMFAGCTSLTQAPALPATKLASNCYQSMFQTCTNLTNAPALPATTLAASCYDSMFKDCTSLTQAPSLPATKLKTQCYQKMFQGCTALTQAPALPATTLADYCYQSMFYGCTGLTQAPELPATTLASSCYHNMFYNCTGLTQAPALPATTLAVNCYRSMFNNCTSLTKAPSELPATTLADSCYMFMFEFTAITAIPRIMATTYATDSCKGMFDDVKTLNVYSSSGPGHTYGWTAPASTYCSGMFGSDDGESEWAKLDGSNFPNSGTPTEGVMYYFATVDAKYLTFSSPNSFTLKVNDTTKHWDGTLEYSTDASTWSTWDGTTMLSSATSGSKDVLYLRGTGNTVITGNNQEYRWVLTGSDVRCKGNIENLLDYATVETGAHPTMASRCYYNMFYGCTSLTQAPALPATTLAYACYYGMFTGCTSLTQAPALPATTLAGSCYHNMFSGCTSLTQAPALPATTLASNCYYGMFNGCTSLTQAPALPATTLAVECYTHMFNGCTKIKLSTIQTGEYEVVYRIPTAGIGTTATDALSNMFARTGGTFTGTPEINTTYYLSNTNTVVG